MGDPSPPLWVMTSSEQTWRRRASCRGAPADLFFPERAQSDPERLEQAKRLCATCPVSKACLVAGMAERYGIWGGLTPAERRALRRRRQRGEAA